MPAWPSSLPALPLADGCRETAPDTSIRTEMDAGPAKVRARTTAGVAQLSLSYIMSRAELGTLEAFFRDELVSGALKFAFPHPRREETVDCRFRRPPAWTPVNGDFFRVGVELEVLP